MDTDLLHASRHLEPRAVTRLAGSAGRRVAVLRGQLWLTVDHDLSDHVLGAGDSFTAGDDRPLLLSAFTESDFLVLDAGQA